MSLFNPKSIAVIGASSTKGKVGHDILRNLLEEGYEGTVYPINPKHKEILGAKAYTSVKDIKDNVDMAIVVVPAKIVPAMLEECAEKKIQNVVVISAGFGEVGTKEGKDLEQQIKKIACQPMVNGQWSIVNLVGPNCLGILNPRIKINASFAAHLPPIGSVALISQSGAMAVAVMDASQELGIGYSLVASIGNKTVMNESDFLRIVGDDLDTNVIAFYLESIVNGPQFLQTAIEVAKKKHIILLKSGSSKRGSEAATSHTGALAGNDAAINALCTQSGITRAHTMQEFLDLMEACSTQPELLSNNIAVITNAGGPGILATDAAQSLHLVMPSLNTDIESALKKSLPEAASTKNPIDVVGDADLARYQAALDAVGKDPQIDGLAVLLTPQVMTPGAEIAGAIIAFAKQHPVMPVVTSFMGDEHVNDMRLHVQKAGVPSFETPERAIYALAALRKNTQPATRNPQLLVNDMRAAAAEDLLGEYTGLIPDDAVQKLFTLYNIPLPKQKLATTQDEAVAIAEDIGYPVIAKISSPQILHKTDIGGIKAHLLTEEEVRSAWNVIMDNTKKHHPDAGVRGILIQKYLEAGNEFIVGAVRDASFGHLVMAGLGGIYTELLNDTAFRIAPIDEEESYRLLQDLISWKLLLGMRGGKQLDIRHIAQLVETVSQMVTEYPQIKDIDLNPVFVHEDHIIVADAKVVIG